jgi:hypothetical protein
MARPLSQQAKNYAALIFAWNGAGGGWQPAAAAGDVLQWQGKVSRQPVKKWSRCFAGNREGGGRQPAAAADGVLDLSMRLTVGFAHRFHRRPLPAVFAVWRQLAQQRRNCM